MVMGGGEGEEEREVKKAEERDGEGRREMGRGGERECAGVRDG